jgi:hypothetical protein
MTGLSHEAIVVEPVVSVDGVPWGELCCSAHLCGVEHNLGASMSKDVKDP